MFVHMRPPAFSRVTVVPAFGVEVLSARFYGHVYDRHFHDGYAFGLTLDGSQTFNARGARHATAPGTAIAFAPGEAHDGEAVDERGFAYWMIYLPEALVGDVLAETGHALPAFPEPLMHAPWLARAVRDAAAALDGPGDNLAQDAAISRLVRAFANVAPEPRTPARAPRSVTRLRELLHDRLAEPVTVDALAAEVGMSRFRLTRAFARAYGLPPHAYLLSLRLNAARRGLLAGEPPVVVAAACGFADQAHLTREFRRRVGVTPGAYRAVSRGSSGTRS
jgi:AraC-like DNA-binding protein